MALDDHVPPSKYPLGLPPSSDEHASLPLSIPSDCLPHQTSMQAVAQKSVGEAATWQAERRQWEEINRQQEEQLHTLQIERATHQGVEERCREMMGQRDAAEVSMVIPSDWFACDCLPHQARCSRGEHGDSL